MKRRGPGRPTVPEAERKAAIFSVRLSAEEREDIEAAAQSQGVRAAAWARLALLDAVLRVAAADEI